MSIYQLSRNNSCIIESLPSLGLLKSLGMREGMKVNVMSKQPFGGPIVLQLGRRSIAISKSVAELITVKEVI
ncbi:FeoA family protein [Alkaliphilus crotonatoxidans]